VFSLELLEKRVDLPWISMFDDGTIEEHFYKLKVGDLQQKRS
jgi:hypothetical protein